MLLGYFDRDTPAPVLLQKVLVYLYRDTKILSYDRKPGKQVVNILSFAKISV